MIELSQRPLLLSDIIVTKAIEIEMVMESNVGEEIN